MILERKREKKTERREVERKVWETEKFHPPPPLIVNIRVGKLSPTQHLHFQILVLLHSNKSWLNTQRINLPTSELQNACWGCAGEQLQASAISSTRHRNRMARVTKQLFAVQVIFKKYIYTVRFNKARGEKMWERSPTGNEPKVTPASTDDQMSE